MELGGVTYRVVEKRLDWTGALHLCESLNGTLATVKDPYQQAYLTLLSNSLRRPAWIALYNYGVNLFTICYCNSLLESHKLNRVFQAEGKTILNCNFYIFVFRDGVSPGWVKKACYIQTGKMGSLIKSLDVVT